MPTAQLDDAAVSTARVAEGCWELGSSGMVKVVPLAIVSSALNCPSMEVPWLAPFCEEIEP